MGALGFIEISGVTAAVDALDIMCKSAEVRFVTWERKLGGRLVTIVIEGDISAVSAAIDNATNLAIKKPVAHLVLANPHEETWRIVNKSASRLAPKTEETPVAETPKKSKKNK
ncbi:MAG: BMC domain-containing protein [Clostridia bacterium]|nr:BMC domain-containing protein [Clostridia bacterium]